MRKPSKHRANNGQASDCGFQSVERDSRHDRLTKARWKVRAQAAGSAFQTKLVSGTALCGLEALGERGGVSSWAFHRARI